jgi:uncharacterized protein YjiS (DUF1127 family)
MAYVSSHRASRHSIFEFAADIVASLKAERARRAVFNQTLGELRRMTDRDLADIGIARVQIEDIAYEAAYGK